MPKTKSTKAVKKSESCIIDGGKVRSPRRLDKTVHVMSLLTAAWQAHLEAKETLRGDDDWRVRRLPVDGGWPL